MLPEHTGAYGMNARATCAQRGSLLAVGGGVMLLRGASTPPLRGYAQPERWWGTTKIKTGVKSCDVFPGPRSHPIPSHTQNSNDAILRR